MTLDDSLKNANGSIPRNRGSRIKLSKAKGERREKRQREEGIVFLNGKKLNDKSRCHVAGTTFHQDIVDICGLWIFSFQ